MRIGVGVRLGTGVVWIRKCVCWVRIRWFDAMGAEYIEAGSKESAGGQEGTGRKLG